MDGVLTGDTIMKDYAKFHDDYIQRTSNKEVMVYAVLTILILGEQITTWILGG